MIDFPFNVQICIESLYLRDSLKANFRQLLRNKAGVYCFQLIETGEIVYIGSTNDL